MSFRVDTSESSHSFLDSPPPLQDDHRRAHAGLILEERPDETPLRSRLSLLDFLWPGPTGRAATIGEPKPSFMRLLGLDERVAYHKCLFEQMKEEGERGCSDLLSDRRREITPVAFEDVEREIFAMASPATRCMYEICASAVDNWVIRWMLWHVIENSGPRPTPTHSHTGVTPIPSPVVEERFVTPPTSNKQVRSDSPLQARPASPQVGPGRRDYWDPIRSP